MKNPPNEKATVWMENTARKVLDGEEPEQIKAVKQLADPANKNPPSNRGRSRDSEETANSHDDCDPMDETKRVWESIYGREVSCEEVDEIRFSVGGFCNLLMECWQETAGLLDSSSVNNSPPERSVPISFQGFRNTDCGHE